VEKVPMELESQAYPELVIGIAGAIGVDIRALTEELTSALADVGYESCALHVTEAMKKFPVPASNKRARVFSPKQTTR
jgi:hypothetical protein